MATLQVKNKYALSLKKLLKDSQDDGGVPDYISVSGAEAWDILNEIRVIGQGGAFGFEVKSTDKYDPQFYLKKSSEKLQREIAEDVITRWFRKEFEVYFKLDTVYVPLIVIPKKAITSAPTHPVKPRPITDEDTKVVQLDTLINQNKTVDKDEESEDNEDT